MMKSQSIYNVLKSMRRASSICSLSGHNHDVENVVLTFDNYVHKAQVDDGKIWKAK